VAAAQCFFEKASAGASGGADDGNVAHGNLQQKEDGMQRILGFYFRKKYLEIRACLFLESFEWTD